MLVIVDYGLGNLGSVANMLKRGGITDVRISAGVLDIERADALIIPGVGHFDAGMKNIRARGLEDPLTRKVMIDKTPTLGICLGMQLFARDSEEGREKGLGWIDAHVRRFAFPANNSHPVPHMGWNETHGSDPVLFRNLTAPGTRFYFVHSYHVVCDNPTDVAATCDYGIKVTAAFHRGNVFGTQFHPEKSHAFGMKILQNFADAARAKASVRA